MYTFVFLWTPALSPNDEDIPHGFIFATFMLSSMLGSSIASRLMARPALKVEAYMQIVFAVSAVTLLLPIITNVRVSFGNLQSVEGMHLQMKYASFYFFYGTVPSNTIVRQRWGHLIWWKYPYIWFLYL